MCCSAQARSTEPIRRLLQDGWIERVDDPLPNNTDRQRKAYALTQPGRQVFQAELQRLDHLVALGRQRMKGETV